MIVKLYIYDKATGDYEYSDTGNPEYVLLDMSGEKEFTLEPLPDRQKRWRWAADHWEEVPENSSEEDETTAI